MCGRAPSSGNGGASDTYFSYPMYRDLRNSDQVPLTPD